MNSPPVFVLAPDSLKGSLSAGEAAAAMAEGIASVFPAAQLRLRPMADGGEGSLDAMLVEGGERITTTVSGAAGDARQADWGWCNWAGERAAVIEVAQVVPLTDALAQATAVSARHTRGVGELLRAALDAGARTLLVALGGSSTNDGGAGLLAALGAKFLDADGAPLPAVPAAFAHLAAIDTAGLDPRLGECRLIALSDVDHPLCGPRGATAVFGPQKGLAGAEIAHFDALMARYAARAEAALGKQAQARPGAGAAGGLGFALQLLGAELRSGAQVVASVIGLDAALCDADWLITGEGRSDAQTLAGKAPIVAAAQARARGVPAILLSGGIDRAALPLLEQHFAACFALPFGPMPLSEAVADARALLADSAREIAQLIRATARSVDASRSGNTPARAP